MCNDNKHTLTTHLNPYFHVTRTPHFTLCSKNEKPGTTVKQAQYCDCRFTVTA